ncbi:hypothetical protein DIZ76_016352 [Coccidioides immitis]|nr:hypothetical protein DIZ76_016352 [Coccidioides immitis]
MGRKPNAIVSEFFHRGNKLPDSSNRYEHTCKLCGENFPKGRPDSLLGHLTKSCQAISILDKQRVIHLLHGLSSNTTGAGKAHGNSRSDRARANTSPYSSRLANFSNPGGLDGLNVLAEASRRVGATNETGQAVTRSQGLKGVVVDPALECPGSAVIDLNEHPTATSIQTSQSSPIQEEPHASACVSDSMQLNPDSLSDLRHSSQLSLIAASASEIVPEDTVEHLDSDQHITQFNHDAHDNAQCYVAYPRPIAINVNPRSHEPISVPGAIGRITKHKSRSAFSEERRKEVQLVRKMGACLRCRMLKKTCSPGTPCSQCRSLQNPRVWMECCVRTRLMTRFEAYSVALHSVLIYHDINNLKNQVHFELSTGRIEVTHFEQDPSYFVTFGTLCAQKPSISNSDPQLPLTGHDTELGAHPQNIHILDGEVEELSGKLDDYMKKVSHRFFESEESVFMQQTLLLAAELGKASQDELLAGVLDLWVATSIIVGPLVPWRVFFNPTLPPATLQPLTSSSNGWHIPITGGDGIESYSLICSQLRAAAEKRAAKTSKAVLNRIEQRLLQRQKEGNFRTFLASLILLNCVERMSWLFYSWEHGEYATRWPLERRPSDFVAQGDRFSSIIATHLKMRSLAPAFLVQPDTGLLKAKDGNDGEVIRWFEAINIDHQFLLSRQTVGLDLSNWRSLDLKYCSTLILSADNLG